MLVCGLRAGQYVCVRIRVHGEWGGKCNYVRVKAKRKPNGQTGVSIVKAKSRRMGAQRSIASVL